MKLLFILMAALMLPVVPALACFDDDGTLFRTSSEGSHGGRNFDRDPLPMSYCELEEPGFVVVNGKCYDFDAITDYDTEEECQADPVCKAYREQQKDGTYHMDCSKVMRPMVGCGDDVVGTTTIPMPPSPEPIYDCSHEGLGQDVCRPIDDDKTDDPNHGEIKGDEELEDEEEHQEEEEQGQETTEETTAETSE